MLGEVSSTSTKCSGKHRHTITDNLVARLALDVATWFVSTNNIFLEQQFGGFSPCEADTASIFL